MTGTGDGGKVPAMGGGGGTHYEKRKVLNRQNADSLKVKPVFSFVFCYIMIRLVLYRSVSCSYYYCFVAMDSRRPFGECGGPTTVCR